MTVSYNVMNLSVVGWGGFLVVLWNVAFRFVFSVDPLLFSDVSLYFRMLVLNLYLPIFFKVY